MGSQFKKLIRESTNYHLLYLLEDVHIEVDFVLNNNNGVDVLSGTINSHNKHFKINVGFIVDNAFQKTRLYKSLQYCILKYYKKLERGRTYKNIEIPLWLYVELEILEDVVGDNDEYYVPFVTVTNNCRTYVGKNPHNMNLLFRCVNEYNNYPRIVRTVFQKVERNIELELQKAAIEDKFYLDEYEKNKVIIRSKA